MFYDDGGPPVVYLPPSEENSRRRNDPSFIVEGASARQRFREFFRNFRLGTIYPYRENLIRHWNRGEYCVEIDVAHLNEYDEALYNSLKVYT